MQAPSFPHHLLVSSNTQRDAAHLALVTERPIKKRAVHALLSHHIIFPPVVIDRVTYTALGGLAWVLCVQTHDTAPKAIFNARRTALLL